MNATEDIVDVMLHHDFQRYGAVMRIVGPAKAYRGTTLPAEDRTVREGTEMVKVLHLRGGKKLWNVLVSQRTFCVLCWLRGKET